MSHLVWHLLSVSRETLLGAWLRADGFVQGAAHAQEPTLCRGASPAGNAWRSYWAVLLIKSELAVQFNVPESGIWTYDEHVPLPTGNDASQLELIPGERSFWKISSSAETRSPEILSYFMAEIAKRRMLQRCTTSIRPAACFSMR